MTEIILWIMLGLVIPFSIYLLFRIIGSALFRTWFEMKKEFSDKQGGKNESKG